MAAAFELKFNVLASFEGVDSDSSGFLEKNLKVIYCSYYKHTLILGAHHSTLIQKLNFQSA